ncbi:MAG: hypothetical protein ABS873_07295, partial [Alkalibacterium sp.]
QKETVYYILKSGGYTEVSNQQVTAALKKGLNKTFSPQTISKRIISTQIKQYIQSRKLLAEKLEEGREVN